jgi:hypothetical protein
MRLTASLIIFLGTYASSVPVLAQDAVVPKYDVKEHCKGIAGFGGTFSEMVMDSCLGMEQSAYNKKGQWGKIAEPIRTHCDEIARFGGVGSYSVFESCVQMETGAAKQNSVSEFKY